MLAAAFDHSCGPEELHEVTYSQNAWHDIAVRCTDAAVSMGEWVRNVLIQCELLVMQ